MTEFHLARQLDSKGIGRSYDCRVVAEALSTIAVDFGFRFNQVNVIAYYILPPFGDVVLIDQILARHHLKTA